jgi:hypothetical protein
MGHSRRFGILGGLLLRWSSVHDFGGNGFSNGQLVIARFQSRYIDIIAIAAIVIVIHTRHIRGTWRHGASIAFYA